MSGWILFWTLFLGLGVSLFAVVAVAVGIGAVSDLRRLLRPPADPDS